MFIKAYWKHEHLLFVTSLSIPLWFLLQVHVARNAQIEARLGLEKKVKTDTRVHMEELTKQRQKNDEKRDEDLEKQHRETNQRVPVHDNVQQSRKSAAFKGRTQRAQALRHWFQSPKSPLQSLP